MKLQREAHFANILAAGFFVLLLVQVWNHIMWRDELRPWQIIRECSTPMQALHEMRFDAVPALWNLIVYVLTRFTDNAFLMQFVHVCIATAVVYVVARWAPFSRTSKVLFAFGYFPFFEYATITRNYSLVFLLVMIACAMISSGRIRLMTLAGVLFLLMQVSIWGAGLAGLLFLAAVACAWMGPAEDRPGVPRIMLAGSILVVGAVFGVLAILPGPGPSFTAEWYAPPWNMRISLSIGSIYRAWVPIPRLGLHFWNTNILDAAPVVQAVLGVVLFGIVAGAIARRPVALLWLILAAGALVGFTLLKFPGAIRHDGMLFIVLIAALWLGRSGPKWEIPGRWGGAIAARLERAFPAWVGGLLAINALAGLMAAGAGMVYPFSATPAVAEYIRTKIDPRATLAAYTDYCAAPISYWLGRPIYSISMRQDVRYNTQDDTRRLHPDQVTGAAILNAVYDLLQKRPAPVLLLLNGDTIVRHSERQVIFPGPGGSPRRLYITDIANPAFERSVVADEAHKLYLVFPAL